MAAAQVLNKELRLGVSCLVRCDADLCRMLQKRLVFYQWLIFWLGSWMHVPQTHLSPLFCQFRHFQAEREVGDRVVFSMAHTRGPVFADTALVDATSARCEQQDQLARLLPELQKQLKVGVDESEHIAAHTHKAA